MSAAPADRLLGALIDGRYRVDRVVGSGGFGTVYRAFHVGLGAPVALKVLALGEARPPERLARHVGALLEEARTLKRLRHPSIAAALDVGFLPGDEAGARLPYLVMEWCEGPTLKQMLERRGGDFASREDVRAQVNGTALGYVSVWGAARYAIDGTRAVIVATSPDAVEAALETLIGHASVETQARAEAQQAPPLSAAARRALAAWTGTDLWAAAALASEQVLFISASTEPASVVIKSGDETRIPMLYTNRVRGVLDALRRSAAKAPFAYALDGDVLLVINGDPARVNAAFVRKLLGGARAAEVGVSTPTR